MVEKRVFFGCTVNEACALLGCVDRELSRMEDGESDWWFFEDELRRIRESCRVSLRKSSTVISIV